MRFGPSALIVVLAAVLALPSVAGSVGALDVPAQTLVLATSAFNITDHNLTYATNMLVLPTPLDASYSMDIRNELVASDAPDRSAQEAQLSFGPPPAGPIEDNITPIFILQESATGLLRLEYVPFAMDNTWAFIVFEGYVATSGPAPFSGHRVTLEFVQSAPPIAPYPRTVPYGYATGNISLLFDGQVLVAHYPIAWSTLTAFYGYGLTTGAFRSGSMSITVSGLSPSPGAPGSVIINGSIGAVPTWAIAGLLAGAVGAALGAVAIRSRTQRTP